MIVLTPTHRLAREMKQRGVNAYAFHSYIRWKGDERMLDRMGETYVTEIVIWDDICTVSIGILKMFIGLLLPKNTAVIMCGDHDQPPLFVGLSKYDWLTIFVDYYEEIITHLLIQI